MSERFADAAARAYRAAVCVFGWTPECFWAATPADLRLALTHDAQPMAPVGRAELARMMERAENG